MDVAALLGQLQKALQKPETCEIECQTDLSYSDVDKSIWDLQIDSMQLCLEELRDSKKRKLSNAGRPKGSKNKRPHFGPEPTDDFENFETENQVTTTPKPLTLEQPPSKPSVKSFETADAVPYTDNISEGFDENEKADEDPDTEDETVIYGAFCPKCEKQANGYTEVSQEFGFKQLRGKTCVQSWCIKCRQGYAKRTGTNETPGSNRSFLPTACTDANRVFDEDVNIINRRGGIFCVSHVSKSENGPTNNGMKFHDTIRKASETWKEAEERHRAKSHPIVQKRGKLMSILAKQENCSMSAIMRKYEGKTTMELFCKIKQESPGLLKPLGQPSPE